MNTEFWVAEFAPLLPHRRLELSFDDALTNERRVPDPNPEPHLEES